MREKGIERRMEYGKEKEEKWERERENKEKE